MSHQPAKAGFSAAESAFNRRFTYLGLGSPPVGLTDLALNALPPSSASVLLPRYPGPGAVERTVDAGRQFNRYRIREISRPAALTRVYSIALQTKSTYVDSMPFAGFLMCLLAPFVGFAICRFTSGPRIENTLVGWPVIAEPLGRCFRPHRRQPILLGDGCQLQDCQSCEQRPSAQSRYGHYFQLLPSPFYPPDRRTDETGVRLPIAGPRYALRVTRYALRAGGSFRLFTPVIKGDTAHSSSNDET